MVKFTGEAVERAEQFVRSIYPTLDDITVKVVASKVLKALPKFIFIKPVRHQQTPGA